MTLQIVGPGGQIDVRDRDDREVGQVSDDYTDYFDVEDRVRSGDGVERYVFVPGGVLVFVRVDGGDGRARPGEDDPTASVGVFCEDGIPQPIPVALSELRVWAPDGATVRIWGFGRGDVIVTQPEETVGLVWSDGSQWVWSDGAPVDVVEAA